MVGAEWGAFEDNLEITFDNHEEKGLKNSYWSSSLRNSNDVYEYYLGDGFTFTGINYYNYVRLVTTF